MEALEEVKKLYLIQLKNRIPFQIKLAAPVLSKVAQDNF